MVVLDRCSPIQAVHAHSAAKCRCGRNLLQLPLKCFQWRLSSPPSSPLIQALVANFQAAECRTNSKCFEAKVCCGLISFVNPFSLQAICLACFKRDSAVFVIAKFSFSARLLLLCLITGTSIAGISDYSIGRCRSPRGGNSLVEVFRAKDNTALHELPRATVHRFAILTSTYMKTYEL